MKRTVTLAALFAVAAIASAAIASASSAGIVYNALPKPLPPNVASLGFEATQTNEFGDYIHLAGTNRLLKTVTVTMSDWARFSDFIIDPRYDGNSVSWTHPITLNIYSAHLGSNGVPDQLMATVTQSITVPWRPAADPTCPDTGYGAGFAWRARDGRCYNGLAFNATFDLSSLGVTLPNQLILSVVYNTQNYGPSPIGSKGPYNSLNVGAPTGQAATVGNDDNPDNVFWNTLTCSYYADHGASGCGTFRQDTGWTPYGTVAFQIKAVNANLKLDKQSISVQQCTPASKHAKQVVNVTYTLTNDADSGFGGNYWATDTLNRHLRIWSLNDGTFCAWVADHGSFVTNAGTSPSSFSTVSAGITGNIDGGYVTNDFTGTPNPTPLYATHGNLGTFDATGAHPSFLSYFTANGWDGSQPGWGWIYKTDTSGTWLNQKDLPANQSGDISG